MIDINTQDQTFTDVKSDAMDRLLGRVTWIGDISYGASAAGIDDSAIPEYADKFRLVSPFYSGPELEIDKTYILSCFWTNAYCIYLGKGKIRVDKLFGDKLQKDRDYLVINPKY